MKKYSMTSLVVAFGLAAASSQAFAGTKVAEFGDPVLGNSYHDCTWTQTYSTGGGGYIYKEYNVVCPAYNSIPAINITAGSVVNNNGPYSGETCTFYVPSGYTTSYNSCSNWRIYKN